MRQGMRPVKCICWTVNCLMLIKRIAYSFVVVVGDGSFIIKETEVGELQIVHDGVMTELWPKLKKRATEQSTKMNRTSRKP